MSTDSHALGFYIFILAPKTIHDSKGLGANRGLQQYSDSVIFLAFLSKIWTRKHYVSNKLSIFKLAESKFMQLLYENFYEIFEELLASID